MFDAYARTVEFSTIVGIAGAIRDELGPEIDAHPGRRDPAEAGQVNRAYRAAARRILRAIAPPSEDLPSLLSWALLQVARRRLAEGGLDERTCASLSGLEPGTRDDWLAFLILTTWDQVLDVLRKEAAGGGPPDPTAPPP